MPPDVPAESLRSAESWVVMLTQCGEVNLTRENRGAGENVLFWFAITQLTKFKILEGGAY